MDVANECEKVCQADLNGTASIIRTPQTRNSILSILDNPVDITLHIRGLVIARRSRATPLQAQLDYMYGTKVEIKALHDCVGGIKKFFTDKIQEQMDAAATNGSPGPGDVSKHEQQAAKCTNVPPAPLSEACGESETSNRVSQSIHVRVCSSGHNSSTSSVAATAETAAGRDRKNFHDDDALFSDASDDFE